MSQRSPRHGKGRPRHRLIPVWKPELDRQQLARILLLLAQHHDEQQRATNEAPAPQKGGKPHEHNTDP